MKKIGLTFALIGVFTVQSQAIDKEKLSDHIRKTINIPASYQIQIGDPEKSEIKGLQKVPVTVRGSQQDIFITPDEKYYIWGNLYDLRVDPDKERASLISLKDVYYKGSKGAKVTIVEYTDLQCPYCKTAHQALNKELYGHYSKDEVRWVMKHFPLGMHNWAEPAAVATECAGVQNEDLVWDMSELFFENTSSIKESNVREKSIEFSKELNLDVPKFTECLDDPKIMDKVQADKQEGIRAGVSSTPTLFVNGRMKRGFRSFQDLKSLIDEKLAEPN